VVVCDSNEDVVLEGVNDNCYPKDVDDEESGDIEVDNVVIDTQTSGGYRVISDTDGDLVLDGPAI